MTTLHKAAMRQALEALERCVSTCFDQYAHEQVMSRPEHFVNQTITALRAALAEEAMQRLTDVQQEIMESEIKVDKAEPVQEQPICDECGKSKRDGWALYCVKCVEPMFAWPQRKPLSEEELDELAMDKDGLPNSHIEFARAIERAHGIGGSNG